MRILVIEDERHLRETIVLNLEMEGYEVVGLEKAPRVLDILHSEHFDLIILDIMLPEVDGLRITELIRAQNRHIKILMISARSTSRDRVVGLQKGANDYMVKPFELEELLFRTTNLLQDVYLPLNYREVYEFGGNRVNVALLEGVNFRGERIVFTKKEILLLKLFLENPNEIQTREKILNRIWGYDVYPNTRTIDNFILKFRKCFELVADDPRFFISKRGVGYVFVM